MMEISKAWSNYIWSMVWVVFVGKYLGEGEGGRGGRWLGGEGDKVECRFG